MVLNTALVTEAGTNVPAVTQWVVFRCRDGRYGFPLSRVSEILPPRAFTRLPGAGPAVCGLTGVRGRLITVFDLGVVLSTGRAASLPDHRLLLLELGTRRVGAVVDDVVCIAPAYLTPATALDTDDLPSGAVRGAGRVEDGGFLALEPQPLLRGLLPA